MTMCQSSMPNQNPRTSQKLDEFGLPEGYLLDDQWEMTPRQVKAMIDAHEDFVLVDCRTPQENHLVRLANAQLIPLQELGSRLQELEKWREKKVVVHCHHGIRSLQMTVVLRRFGISSAWSMAGGIDLWAIDVEPTMVRY